MPWSVIASAGMPMRGGLGEQVVEPRRAVEHRVLGVHVQVDEGVAGDPDAVEDVSAVDVAAGLGPDADPDGIEARLLTTGRTH